MKSFALGVAAVVLLSVSLLAGEYLVNEEVAYGLRVTFTEPVTLTYFGDVLLEVSPPEGESDEFLFSGAELPAWVGHGLAWTPTSARITSYEWLSQQEVAAIGVVRVPLTLTETFSVVLTAASGDAIDATITRTVSQEQIPFVVEYAIESPNTDLTLTWARLSPSLQIEGSEARFVQLSNADPVVFLLEATDSSGTTYRWEDEIDFLLHNKTEIALDATQFVREEEIASVQWSAANGDPDDARTFPIADVSATTTTLVSEWPNVLEIECEITKQDGSVVSKQVDALVYFRDGTPFEIRSVQAPIYHSLTHDELTEIVERELPRLADLGANSITHETRWWFGPPDEDSNWNVHPIYNSMYWRAGNTPSLESLAYYIDQAKEAGFQFHVTLLQYPYNNDLQLRKDIWEKYYPFRSSDSFLYGDGSAESGYLAELMYYVPLLIEHDVDTVFLSAEIGEYEKFGNEKTRSFFREVISQYRAAGYGGDISYAAGIDWYPHQENFAPSECGIPWADMDYVAFTYYPHLATTNEASTREMYLSAKGNVDQFFRPLSVLYSKPVFVQDFYCEAWDGCAVEPLANPNRVLDQEEARRYHTAVLRAFSEANTQGETPLIYGTTMGVYSMVPESWIANAAAREPAAADLHYQSHSRLLQLLMKVFYRDVPLEGGGR